MPRYRRYELGTEKRECTAHRLCASTSWVRPFHSRTSRVPASTWRVVPMASRREATAARPRRVRPASPPNAFDWDLVCQDLPHEPNAKGVRRGATEDVAPGNQATLPVIDDRT